MIAGRASLACGCSDKLKLCFSTARKLVHLTLWLERTHQSHAKVLVRLIKTHFLAFDVFLEVKAVYRNSLVNKRFERRTFRKLSGKISTFYKVAWGNWLPPLRWISTWWKMSRARLFPFVLGALEWNEAEIYLILTMQLSRARHFASNGNPPLTKAKI